MCYGENGEMIEIPQLVKAYSQVLREARIKAGLSQGEIAKLVRCSRTFITALENENYQPTLNAFVAVAYALGISPSELMQRVENKLAFLSYLDSAKEKEESEKDTRSR